MYSTSVFLAAVILGLAHANFLFEIQFHAYRNPLRADASGGCCDSSSMNNTPPNCRSDCDTYFQICLRNSSVTASSNCPLGSLETDLIVRSGGDDILFETETLDTSGDIPNPAQFPNNQPWPGFIQVEIVSIDRDGGNDDFIDIELINLDSLEVQSPNFTLRRTYIGARGNSRYELSFRVNCAPDYYSPSCTVFCRGRNDSLGHYYCNESSGEIECLEGYIDTSTNCTQCETSAGCSISGGFCTVPFECICFEGYSGQNCTTAPTNVAMIGGIAGGATIVLLLLLISLIAVLTFALAVICNRRKQKVSTPEYDSTMRRKSAENRVFQENTSYIDLIARDSLSRSTELIISSGGSHYQLDPPPKAHIKKLSTTTDNSMDTHPTYSTPVYSEPSAIMAHNTNTGASNTGSSTSLQKVQFYSSTMLCPSSTTDGQIRQKPKPKPKPRKDRAQSVTDLTQEEKIPMRRNNSYRMLDTGDLGTNSAEGNEYSYPRLHHTDKGAQPGYTTVAANTEHDPYSKIELSNMYENIEAEENMMENGLYGSQARGSDYFVTGLNDAYMNEGLGPK